MLDDNPLERSAQRIFHTKRSKAAKAYLWGAKRKRVTKRLRKRKKNRS